MSLVPYDGSDFSDSDEADESNGLEGLEAVKQPSPETHDSKHVNNSTNNQEEDELSSKNLFKVLPQPRNNSGNSNDTPSIVEEIDDEILRKKPIKSKEKKPVRIAIPSLSQTESNTDDITIKKFTSATNKGTGLFAVLPPPKCERTYIFKPQSVTQRDNNTNNEEVTPRSEPIKRPATRMIPDVFLKKKPRVNNDDDDNHDDETNDFFSLTRAPEKLEVIEETTEIADKPLPIRAIDSAVPVVFTSQYSIPSASSTSISNEVDDLSCLDEETLRKLCGKRVAAQQLDIVDVREQDVRPDKSVWIQEALKEGTDPTRVPIRDSSGPGGVTKRKHQITYLAHQAKVNEQQLQGVWSQNRANQQMARSKYGF